MKPTHRFRSEKKLRTLSATSSGPNWRAKPSLDRLEMRTMFSGSHHHLVETNVPGIGGSIVSPLAVPDSAPVQNGIRLYGAKLVTSQDQTQAHIDKGEEIFIEADWTTQNVPAGTNYRIAYSVNGVTLETSTLSYGSGTSGTGYWYWYLGGWFASPGKHTVKVSIDPTTASTTSETFSFTPVTATDLPHKFITPLGGTPFTTWGIVNYVDVNPLSGAFEDFAGGNYTYDGHTGHDMTLADFGSMDSGVPDFAAAAGTVIDVQDGNYDRNTAMGNEPANYVIIDNGNGWHSIYYHLREDSILVHVGESVVAGQVLGLAGSSGSSTLAHLHFELQHNGDIVEPEYDPKTYWVHPLAYQGSLSSVLNSGISGDEASTISDLNAEERPVNGNVFSQASGQQFTAWVHAFTRAGDTLAFDFYEPNGQAFTGLDDSFSTGESRGGYYYYYNDLPGDPALGTWKVKVLLDGKTVQTDSFQVTRSGQGAARVVAGSTYAANDRTTPISFGSAAPKASPPRMTFTVQNVGSAALSLTRLVLPWGYSLIGSLPATVPLASSISFTVQLNTTASGTFAGLFELYSNASNAPVYEFNITGIVTGGHTGEVHGQIFDDLNKDGIEENGDNGLTGWSISLLNSADKIVSTATTSFNGYYAFYNVAPGTYHVQESLPSGWSQTTAKPAAVSVNTADVLASPVGATDKTAVALLVKPRVRRRA